MSSLPAAAVTRFEAATSTAPTSTRQFSNRLCAKKGLVRGVSVGDVTGPLPLLARAPPGDAEALAEVPASLGQ